jgi:hypothetical protein
MGRAVFFEGRDCHRRASERHASDQFNPQSVFEPWKAALTVLGDTQDELLPLGYVNRPVSPLALIGVRIVYVRHTVRQQIGKSKRRQIRPSDSQQAAGISLRRRHRNLDADDRRQSTPGPAFDQAGAGSANPQSLLDAIRLAALLSWRGR